MSYAERKWTKERAKLFKWCVLSPHGMNHYLWTNIEVIGTWFHSLFIVPMNGFMSRGGRTYPRSTYKTHLAFGARKLLGEFKRTTTSRIISNIIFFLHFFDSAQNFPTYHVRFPCISREKCLIAFAYYNDYDPRESVYNLTHHTYFSFTINVTLSKWIRCIYNQVLLYIHLGFKCPKIL